MHNNPQREFLRHSVQVPLEVTTVGAAPHTSNRGFNVSFGGLAFIFDDCLDTDQVIQIRIATVQPPFEASARVVWCRPEGDKFLVGAQFLDATAAFKSRMVEQVCSIENYRKEMQAEGRDLSNEEAANEWIQKYAGRFPDIEIDQSGTSAA